MRRSWSPIQLGLVWQRLNGLMDEVAHAFVRTSFSVVVRENWDLAVSLLDHEGRQFAQSSRSVPSFIGTMPRTVRAMLERYPRETLEPGDVLIANDPWIGSGHLNDITMVQPLFRGGDLLCFVGSTFHSVDIGGAPSPAARDVYEEGLCIPVCKVVRRGEESREVVDFLTENLRAPEETLGDMRAQFTAYRLCAERLARLLDEERIDDLYALTAEILDRSEASMRRVLRTIPDGEYADEITADGFDHPLVIRVAIAKRGDEIVLDYAGTSPQIDRPVNCVMGYTFAYSCYAIKCALDPSAPNNDGSFRPITIRAPEGCLVNPRRPAPVWGRHVTGHYLPFVLHGALARVIPDRVIADSGGPLWNVYFKGTDGHGRKFVRLFFMNGGHGARPTLDGPSCLSFPSNVANTPIEQFENSLPMVVTEKQLVTDSGGVGRHRGGAGQRLSFKSVSPNPITFVIRHERIIHPPRGLNGGGPGAPGLDLLNGAPIPSKTQMTMAPGDVVTFQTPGGGGMYPAADRDPALVRRDVEDGLVSPGAARRDYGVDVGTAGPRGR
jgi:N-methylhydantoinase B